MSAFGKAAGASNDDDPFDDPGFRAWARSVREDMLPKMRDSRTVVTLITGTDADVKLAVETGFALLLDKPLILAVSAGVHVPDRLVRIADAIVEFDPDYPARTQAALVEAMARVLGDLP